MPPGVSDTWVTGYVGWSLLAVADRYGLDDARAASARAAHWLRQARYPRSGWGYNRASGPDTDSTGIAITLLRAHEIPVSEYAAAFVRRAWMPGGGFTTFPGHTDGWGCAHVDISWPAFGALPPDGQASLGPELIEWLKRERREDGLWRGYWWKEPYYASYHAELALQSLGIRLELPPLHVSEWQTEGMAATAFCAGLLNRWEIETGTRDRLLAKLLDSQLANGSWTPCQDLRLTARSARPSDPGPLGGPYFMGERSLVDTSGILRVLSLENWQGAISTSPLIQFPAC